MPSGSTMWRRSARARSISACSNISGVVRVGRAWVIRSTRAEVSTPSSNPATAVAILRGLRAVMEPRTAVTADVTV